jgi:hypothetical protein
MFFHMKKKVTIPGPVIDQEALAKRYQVDQKGTQAGCHNNPRQTESEPDAHEQAIVQAMHEEHFIITAVFDKQLKPIHDQQLQLAEHADPQRLVECAANAEQEFRSHQALSREPLRAAWQQQRAAIRDKRAFAHVHRLGREAVYPESRALHMAVLCFMTVVEASANAYAFSFGAAGVLGGLVQALMVAGLNVALACCVGFGLRWLNSAKRYLRLLAASGGLLYLAVLGSYHLVVAHYRAALTVDPDKAAALAITRFLDAPAALYELHDWMLVIVGLLFAAGAVIAGYRLDDEVPGYGAVARQYKAAEAEYRHLKEQYFAGIQMVRDTYLDAVETCRTDASRAIVAYKEGMAHAEQLLRRYIDITQSLNEACVGLIRRYRAANAAVRDEPEPPCFHDEPQPGIVPDKALLEMAALATAQNVVTHSHGQQTCSDQAAVAKEQIRDLYRAALDEAPIFFDSNESATDRPWTDENVMEVSHDERQSA